MNVAYQVFRRESKKHNNSMKVKAPTTKVGAKKMQLCFFIAKEFIIQVPIIHDMSYS